MAALEKIHILKFRNLSDQYFTPDKATNLILGKNGQGKTNLIESLYYLGHGRSFKTKNLKDIVPFDDHQIQITAIVDGQKISLNKTRDKSQVVVDGKKISSNSFLSQLLPIQIISPDRGFVVGGVPKLKRSYLDWGVYHDNENTLKTYAAFKKTLKNINTLLNNGEQTQLDEWLVFLATLSVEITKDRFAYIASLSTVLKENKSKEFASLVESPFDFIFKLQTGWPKEIDPLNEQKIISYLLNSKKTLMKTKHLNSGPHRANIDFSLDGQGENYLSRGEQKKMSFVFWMLQVLELVKNKKKPIVLIDDISSELDEIKIKSIIDFLTDIEVQIFMTDIGNNKLPLKEEKSTSFSIENGVITRF
ncbi:DNA replication and repair protein RecF [Candidatus Thioglobus sp.]|nr:DNA replication and repair protein RecF [Candidatus Thioglobus sp.]